MPNGLDKKLSADTREVGLAFSRYQIVQELGRGGMGVVYKAYDTNLKRHIALKLIGQAHNYDKARERFTREASLMARLDHPHIIKVFDVGEEHGHFFYTMELIAGYSMQQLLSQGISLSKLLKILTQVASAVHYAHEQGIIHRDLKPSNILLTGEMVPKVMDFGLAREMDARGNRLSKSQDIVGTPEYMSPEQIAGKNRKLDARSDVYSLGVILYETLTGKRPFTAPNTMAILYQISFEDPLPPSHFVPRISLELEAICLKALQKDCNKRYQTARDLAEDLERYLQGAPVLAKPITPVQRAYKWAARHRLVCGLALLTLLMVAGFIGFLLHVNNMTNAEKKKAQVKALDAVLHQAQAELVLATIDLKKTEWSEVARRYDKAQALLHNNDVTNWLQETQVHSVQHQHHALLSQSLQDMQDYAIVHYPTQFRDVPWPQMTSASPESHILCNCLPNVLLTLSQPSWKFNMIMRQEPRQFFLSEIASGGECELPDKFLSVLEDAAFRNDDQWLALGNRYGNVVLWDMKNREAIELEPITNIVSTKGNVLRKLQWSPDGNWLCVALEEHYLVCHVPSKRYVYHTVYFGRNPCIAFSRNNKYLALGTVNHVLILSLDANKPGAAPIAKRAALPISIVFGPRDKNLIIGERNDIRISHLALNEKQGEQEAGDITLLDAHAGSICDLALNHDETRFASVGEDGRIVVWSTYLYRQLFTDKVPGGISGKVALAFSPVNDMLGVWKDGNFLGYSLASGQYRQLDLAKRPEIKVFQTFKNLFFHTLARTRGEERISLAISPNRQLLAFALLSKIYLWQLATDQIIELPATGTAKVRIFFASDSLLLAHATEVNRISAWDTASFKLVFTQDPWRGGHCQPNLMLAASQGEQKDMVAVWKLAPTDMTCQSQWTLATMKQVGIKTFSPDGRYLALSDFRQVDVWQIDTPKPQLLASAQTTGFVDGCISLDDSHVVMTNHNGDLWISNWRKWGKEITPQSKPIAPVRRMAESVKRIWYQPSRRLYWIYTGSALSIYPHVEGEFLPQKQKERFLQDAVDNIYPLPVYPGYPFVALDISPDFQSIALVLLSGEIRLLNLRPSK